jgi:hypothetical protein
MVFDEESQQRTPFLLVEVVKRHGEGATGANRSGEWDFGVHPRDARALEAELKVVK